LPARRLMRWGVIGAAVLALTGGITYVRWPAQSLDSKTVCLYAGRDPAALSAFSRSVGWPVNCTVLFNNANPGWAGWVDPWFTHPLADGGNWVTWLKEDPAVRRVVVTQQMVPDAVPQDWRELGAAGSYDGYARRLAANLVAAGMGNAVIRLGAEMNGTWNNDSLGNDPHQYRDWAIYWARIVEAMRSVSGAHFIFDWNINAGYRDIPFDSYYPGNSVVDVVGIDVYDAGMPGNPKDPAARWQSLYREPGGLTDILAFAKTHDKPVSVPEWGLVGVTSGGGGDNPSYVNGIVRTIKDNLVLYQSYFNRAANGVLPLQDAPAALRVWKRDFGPGGAVAGRQW
jgi:hypothetical protein